MVSPGLAPGRTLSASDMLRRVAPWDAQVPANIPPFGSNGALFDSVLHVPALPADDAREPARHPALEPVCDGRPALRGQRAVGGVLPLQRAGIRAAVLAVARGDRRVQAVRRRVRDLPAGRALGMRFGGALLAGTAFGFSFWMVAWLSWPLSSVWAFLPWLCLMADRMVTRPGPLPFAGLLGRGRPSVLRRTPRVQLSRAVLRRAVLGPADGHRRAGRRRAVGVRALQFGGALLLGTALAAIAVIPFVELLAHSVDVSRARRRGPRHSRPTTCSGCCCTTTGGGRRASTSPSRSPRWRRGRTT